MAIFNSKLLVCHQRTRDFHTWHGSSKSVLSSWGWFHLCRSGKQSAQRPKLRFHWHIVWITKYPCDSMCISKYILYIYICVYIYNYIYIQWIYDVNMCMPYICLWMSLGSTIGQDQLAAMAGPQAMAWVRMEVRWMGRIFSKHDSN